MEFDGTPKYTVNYQYVLEQNKSSIESEAPIHSEIDNNLNEQKDDSEKKARDQAAINERFKYKLNFAMSSAKTLIIQEINRIYQFFTDPKDYIVIENNGFSNEKEVNQNAIDVNDILKINDEEKIIFDINIQQEKSDHIQNHYNIKEVDENFKSWFSNENMNYEFGIDSKNVFEASNLEIIGLTKIYPENATMRTSKFTCEYCNRIFLKKCYLSQHINAIHVQKDYKCLKCNKKFVTEKILNAHVEKHFKKNNYACSQCEKTYVNKIDLKNHFQRNHECLDDYQCDECGKRFLSRAYLQRHKNIHMKKLLAKTNFYVL